MFDGRVGAERRRSNVRVIASVPCSSVNRLFFAKRFLLLATGIPDTRTADFDHATRGAGPDGARAASGHRRSRRQCRRYHRRKQENTGYNHSYSSPLEQSASTLGVFLFSRFTAATTVYCCIDAHVKSQRSFRPLAFLLSSPSILMNKTSTTHLARRAFPTTPADPQYYEFIPLAYNLVNAFQARRRACEQMDEANLDLDQQVT